jgi:hypothetical protein
MVLKQSDGEYAIDLIEMKQERNEAMYLYSCIVICTRAVRRVFSHFEYLENRLRGLDVQSEETFLCIPEQSLSCGAGQSAVGCR